MYTWLLGSVVILIIALPWQDAAWPIAIFTDGFLTPLINLFASGSFPSARMGSRGLTWRVSRVLILVLLMTALMFQTVLRSGVTP